MSLSRRGWYLTALVSGALAVLVACWSYLVEEPREPGAGPFVAYVLLPMAVYVSGALSLGRHKRMMLLTVALLDVESAALGFGLLVVLIYILIALKWGPVAGANPWGSRGFEWDTPSPPPPENYPETPVYTHGPHEDYDVPTPAVPAPAGSPEPRHV